MHQQILEKLEREHYGNDRPDIWHLPDKERERFTLCGIDLGDGEWADAKGGPGEKCVVCLDLAPSQYGQAR